MVRERQKIGFRQPCLKSEEMGLGEGESVGMMAAVLRKSGAGWQREWWDEMEGSGGWCVFMPVLVHAKGSSHHAGMSGAF